VERKTVERKTMERKTALQKTVVPGTAAKTTAELWPVCRELAMTIAKGKEAGIFPRPRLE